MKISMKDLVELLRNTQQPEPFDNGMLGEYVLVRCTGAGVHAGFLEAHSGQEVVLIQSRRLWQWKCAKGAFLSGVAKYGIDPAESRVGTELERIHLTEACEVIPCSDEAGATIMAAASHNE